MRTTIQIAAVLALALPGLGSAQERTISAELGATTLETALRRALPGVELKPPAIAPDDAGLSSRVSLRARGVPVERFVEVLLSSAGLEGNEVSGSLWIQRATGDGPRVEIEDLEGFERLEVAGTDVLEEARERAEARLDPLTRAYLRYRRQESDRRAGEDTLRGGRGFMGVRLASSPGHRPPPGAPSAVEEAMATWDGWGAFVLEVVPEGPAANSGIMAGDVIVKFAGLWVDSPATLMRLASRAETGRDIEIEVLREGTVRREYVVIGKRPERRR